MKLLLDAEYLLSKELTGDGVQKIKKYISDETKDILYKGLPKDKLSEAPKILESNISRDAISIKIESGTYVRAHSVAIRLKNSISSLLGKEFKVGIKKVTGKTYTLSLELDKIPKDPIKIPFVENISIEGNNAILILTNLDEEFLTKNYVDRIINLFYEKVEAQFWGGKGEHWELISKSENKEPITTKDPTSELLALGWLKQGPSQGQWFYHAPIAALLRTMERIAVEEVLKPLGFIEVIAPKMVPFEIWEKTGHLSGSEPEIYYISPPISRDISVWEEVIDLYKITKKAYVEKIRERMRDPIGGMTYAQCPPMYWAFDGKTIDDSEFPVLIYDKSGPSYRWEAGGRQGIERVNEFWRIEPVFIGYPEQLIELKEKMMERYAYVFNKIFEIEWRTAWVTPFYMAQAGQTGIEKETERIKGTVDYESWIPSRGSREESEWLEFQNLSIVGDKYTKAFSIKSSKNKELWSGCSGIGLQRWTVSFLAQKGLDSDNWPKEFKKYLGEFPRQIKFV
ncbi:MAG TPA: serine--tRNA ligase [Methanofastidiosum sp.]|nr:serine--tRNA ligase [Methanofastidiosum sp.]HOC77440.1 serine--tRNA ligase [Methanofastidiosum sp.]HPA49266.1 serine--tRNA ligase [Methanofastidiosum sp.]HQK62691.1 serine--tRNA ligase [Methanofastidiosum sp.]HQM94562.1 serine--tRNA ligase [Methanofastidiosum sp.]